MRDIPATSPTGAWKRGAELRATMTAPKGTGPHTHASDDGDEDGHGSHAHDDLSARLDEHHQRLLNLEKGNS
jgi:hypothetical protein